MVTTSREMGQQCCGQRHLTKYYGTVTEQTIPLPDGYRESTGSWADLLRDCRRRVSVGRQIGPTHLTKT